MRTAEKTVSWLIFLQREDFSTTFSDSSSCSILLKARLLRRNKKQTAVINIRTYKRVSGKKKGVILTFRMFQHTSLYAYMGALENNCCFNLRVVFQSTHRIKSLFPYKDRLTRAQMSRVV